MDAKVAPTKTLSPGAAWLTLDALREWASDRMAPSCGPMQGVQSKAKASPST